MKECNISANMNNRLLPILLNRLLPILLFFTNVAIFNMFTPPIARAQRRRLFTPIACAQRRRLLPSSLCSLLQVPAHSAVVWRAPAASSAIVLSVKIGEMPPAKAPTKTIMRCRTLTFALEFGPLLDG